MKEIWKEIKGYENLYMISSYGRVKSLDRWIEQQHKNGKLYKRLIKGKILLQHSINRGYMFVYLFKNGNGKLFLIHRLVAQAFIPNPYNLPYINHKDENKTNNFVYINEDGTVNLEKSNLEWCDQRYNVNYGTGLERRRIKSVNNSKLSKPVLQIDKTNGKVIAEFPSTQEVQRQLGYKSVSIIMCCNNKPHRITAYGYIWRYKEESVT